MCLPCLPQFGLISTEKSSWEQANEYSTTSLCTGCSWDHTKTSSQKRGGVKSVTIFVNVTWTARSFEEDLPDYGSRQPSTKQAAPRARQRAEISSPPTTTLHHQTTQNSGHNPSHPSISIHLGYITIMYRQALTKALRPAARSSIQYRAAFSTTVRAMAEGDTGGVRSGGGAQGFEPLQSWKLEDGS